MAATPDPDNLRALVAALGAELSALFPELAADARDHLTLVISQFQLFEAVVTLLQGIAAERPTVIVLDDLHWADHSSLLLLRHVAREVASSPILILGTYRESELPTSPRSRTRSSNSLGNRVSFR